MRARRLLRKLLYSGLWRFAFVHLKRMRTVLTVERRVRALCLLFLWSPDDEAVLRLLPRFTKAVLQLEEKVRLQRQSARRRQVKQCT
jgi:hypothetical protein